MCVLNRPVAQTVKSLPAMQETRLQSLAREDPLEKEMATHSRTLAWQIPWTEEQGRKESDTAERLKHSLKVESIGRITKSILKMLP